MNTNKAVIGVITILGISGILSELLSRGSTSFAGFVLAAIAAFLSGIFVELQGIRKALEQKNDTRAGPAEGPD